MKITNNSQNKRVGQEGIRSGFTDRDTNYLNKTDRSHRPIQMLGDEMLEEEEQRHYFCASCKGKLDYVNKAQVWR